MRHIVDENGARAALAPVASELGAGEAKLVAQRHRERFVFQHINAALLAVDVDRDEPLDRAGKRRFVLADDRGAEEESRGRHRCARRDDALDESTSRDAACHALFVHGGFSLSSPMLSDQVRGLQGLRFEVRGFEVRSLEFESSGSRTKPRTIEPRTLEPGTLDPEPSNQEPRTSNPRTRNPRTLEHSN